MTFLQEIFWLRYKFVILTEVSKYFCCVCFKNLRNLIYYQVLIASRIERLIILSGRRKEDELVFLFSEIPSLSEQAVDMPLILE